MNRAFSTRHETIEERDPDIVNSPEYDAIKTAEIMQEQAMRVQMMSSALNAVNDMHTRVLGNIGRIC